MFRDRDYVVKDDEVLIVDEFTGRIMPGRRYSDGLHQAIEAKEHVKVKRESKTLATITFQNFFNKYAKKSGMTGTALTEEKEFREIYGMDVVEIPTNRPVIRKDLDDAVYMTKKEKFRAVVEAIKEAHEKGQPVLVGTITIETSELLSSMLKRQGIKHNVLNAKFHELEAEIVKDAGIHGAVTIATNMAGRGTDIKLDDKAKEAGGLKIIGTERHESRRIDNQLRGRSGRQGDPGESRFYISLEDDLMRLFGSESLMNTFRKLGVAENEQIEHKMLSSAIEKAQKKIEGNNYGIRKNLLDYDQVNNEQREIIYIGVVAVLHAFFKDEVAVEAFLDGPGEGQAAMVGLHGAAGDDGVRALIDRVGHAEVELTGLVASGGAGKQVIALDVDVDVRAESFGEVGKRFQRRRFGHIAATGKLGEIHNGLLWV